MRKKIQKRFINEIESISFTEIDKKILLGWECQEFHGQSKKYLSMLREQTNSAINNKRYWG